MSSTSVTLNKANIGKRLVAFLLDGLVTMALSLPGILCLLVGVSLQKNSYRTDDIGVLLANISLFLFLIPLVYLFLKDGLSNGQSIGKKAVGLSVVHISDLSPCTIGSSCLRNLISGLITCMPLAGWIVEPILIIATRDGRKLGDRTAKTQVISINK